MVKVELVDQAAKVPPCHSADFLRSLVEETPDASLSPFDVARPLGWCLSSVAEGVVGFGEDPVAGYEMQGRPSRGLGSVHGEPHNNATEQPDKILVADQLSGNGSPSPSVVHGPDRDCSSLPVMGG